jgi:hypothetical protein
VAIVTFSLSLALDFKAEEGGNLWQIPMVLSAFVSFVGVVLFTPVSSPSREYSRLWMTTAAVIALGLASAVIFHAPWEHTSRVCVPFFLYLAALRVGVSAASSRKSLGILYHAMMVGATIALIFRYIYATHIAHLAIEEMRYQILSPVNVCLLAYIGASFAFSRRISFWPLITTSLLAIVILLAVTRVYLITGAFFLAAIWAFVRKLDDPTARISPYRQTRRAGFSLLIIALIGGLIVAVALRPEVLQLWYARVFHQKSQISGTDITLITRLAEAKGIWHEISATPISILIGRGFGNSYYWSLDYLDELRAVYGSTSAIAFSPIWYAGHSSFTYALFFGGLVGLSWQMYAFSTPIRQAFRLVLPISHARDDEILRFYLCSALSVILFLSEAFTSNPFAERMAAQYLGLASGILLGLRPRPSPITVLARH